MIRRMTLTLCLVVGCMWCMALVAGGEETAPKTGHKRFEPVSSVGSLMRGQGNQLRAIGELLKDPEAKKRSSRIFYRAEVLAELSNINVLHGEKEDYRQWAGQLRDTALALAAEAKKKSEADEDKYAELFQAIKATCGACHDAYQ